MKTRRRRVPAAAGQTGRLGRRAAGGEGPDKGAGHPEEHGRSLGGRVTNDVASYVGNESCSSSAKVKALCRSHMSEKSANREARFCDT